MASVKELFAMTNEALLEAWHKAKLDDLEWRLLIRMKKPPPMTPNTGRLKTPGSPKSASLRLKSSGL